MGYAILDQRGGDSLTATTLDGYSLLADTTVSSATNMVTFSGFSLGWNEEMYIFIEMYNSLAFSDGIELYVNGNTTNTNYYHQSMTINGTSISSQRANNGDIFASWSGVRTEGFIKIKLTNNGFFVAQSETFVSGTGMSTNNSQKKCITSTFVITSISSLTFKAQGSNAIGVGSRFQLYKSGGGASRTWAIT